MYPVPVPHSSALLRSHAMAALRIWDHADWRVATPEKIHIAAGTSTWPGATQPVPNTATYFPGQLFKETLLRNAVSPNDAQLPPEVAAMGRNASEPSVVTTDDFEGTSDCSTTDTQDAVQQTTPSQENCPSLGFPDMCFGHAPDRHAIQLDVGDCGNPLSHFPTVGSRNHHLGTCRPCGFVHSEEGCLQGASCTYCHLCLPGARKERKREKRQLKALARQMNCGASPPGLCPPRQRFN